MSTHGGITQLVEYPVHTRYVICSNQIAATRPVGQAVKTPPFHGGNMGSIPVRVTMKNSSSPTGEGLFSYLTQSESNPSNASARWAFAARRLDGGCSLMKSIPVRFTMKNSSSPKGEGLFSYLTQLESNPSPVEWYAIRPDSAT